MLKNKMFAIAAAGLLLASCSNDDDTTTVTPEAGNLLGGPFTFIVDGTPDNVSGITLEGDRVGENFSYVITDDTGSILGLPPDLAALEGVDFDGAGTGTCFIYYLRYEGELAGLSAGENIADFNGNFDLSNSIEVIRNGAPTAGNLVGGPFTFIVDGMPDMVSGITIEGNSVGTESSFVVTDADGNILGLPPTNDALEGVDFDGAGTGVCLIWYLRYEPGLTGLEAGQNIDGLQGFFDLSNTITVTRNGAPDAGMIAGGPFEFCVDGEADMVSGISQSGTLVGTERTWVITDDAGNILGLPPTLDAVEGVDFDGAGGGTCFIWYLRYEPGLTGLEAGQNVDGLDGFYDLSNSIEVVRNAPDAGMIEGGPFTFTVDGTPDMVSGITQSGTLVGTERTWVITDDAGNILGLPPTLDAVEGVDFDAAGTGVCLIWYLRYEPGLTGLEAGMNANDLEGCFDLSNSITVTRN